MADSRGIIIVIVLMILIDHDYDHDHDYEVHTLHSPLNLELANLILSWTRRKTGMFTVSEMAAKEIQSLISQYNNPSLGLRVRVLAGGCSGYSYDLAFDDQVQENDMIFETNGVKVMIDDRSFKVLDGTQLDYVDTMLGRGFTFSNPNAKSTCGCGTSFNA